MVNAMAPHRLLAYLQLSAAYFLTLAFLRKPARGIMGEG
jgi:hypothetical protein